MSFWLITADSVGCIITGDAGQNSGSCSILHTNANTDIKTDDRIFVFDGKVCGSGNASAEKVETCALNGERFVRRALESTELRWGHHGWAAIKRGGIRRETWAIHAGNSDNSAGTIKVRNSAAVESETYTDDGVDIVPYVGSARHKGRILIAAALTKIGKFGGDHVADVGASVVHTARDIVWMNVDALAVRPQSHRYGIFGLGSFDGLATVGGHANFVEACGTGGAGVAFVVANNGVGKGRASKFCTGALLIRHAGLAHGAKKTVRAREEGTGHQGDGLHGRSERESKQDLRKHFGEFRKYQQFDRSDS